MIQYCGVAIDTVESLGCQRGMRWRQKNMGGSTLVCKSGSGEATLSPHPPLTPPHTHTHFNTLHFPTCSDLGYIQASVKVLPLDTTVDGTTWAVQGHFGRFSKYKTKTFLFGQFQKVAKLLFFTLYFSRPRSSWIWCYKLCTAIWGYSVTFADPLKLWGRCWWTAMNKLWEESLCHFFSFWIMEAALLLGTSGFFLSFFFFSLTARHESALLVWMRNTISTLDGNSSGRVREKVVHSLQMWNSI